MTYKHYRLYLQTFFVIIFFTVYIIYSYTHRTKDKTRVLAHSRRQRENDTFTGIAEALPIQENTKDLDKASVLRVAIHFLKLRDVIAEGEEEQRKKVITVKPLRIGTLTITKQATSL